MTNKAMATPKEIEGERSRLWNMATAKVGIKNKVTTTADSNAKVLVNAKGLKSLPSAPVIVKTGIKLMIVVSTAVTMAPETSVVATYTTSSVVWSALRCSKCLRIFSDKITPRSTMVPMAIAIPERATILASTPKSFIAINTIRIATGSNPEINNEAFRLYTMTTTIRMVIRTSKMSAKLSVSKVS